jgi:hypothetical protein
MLTYTFIGKRVRLIERASAEEVEPMLGLLYRDLAESFAHVSDVVGIVWANAATDESVRALLHAFAFEYLLDEERIVGLGVDDGEAHPSRLDGIATIRVSDPAARARYERLRKEAAGVIADLALLTEPDLSPSRALVKDLKERIALFVREAAGEEPSRPRRASVRPSAKKSTAQRPARTPSRKR